MSKRELIARELDRMLECDVDAPADAATPMLAAESSLAKDWLTPEEDAAWASL